MKPSDRIYLTTPARKWDNCLPLGNGRLGMMILGKTEEEVITLNEESLWYGPARKRTNPEGRQYLDQIRRLLLEGKVSEASILTRSSMGSMPKYNNAYQPAGDVRIYTIGHQKPEEYCRYLELDTATAHVEYKLRDAWYRREAFVSHAYQVGVIRITGEEPFTCTVHIGRQPFEENSGKIDDKTVGNWGQSGVDGVLYFSGARAWADVPVQTIGDSIVVRGAQELVLYVDCATDFSEDESRNPAFRQECLARLERAEKKGFDGVKAKHLEEYQALYNPMDFVLDSQEAAPMTDTASMLAALKDGDKTWLADLTMLLFRFARYLLISSSFDCKLPANLQGIWNGLFQPPWQSEYTININIEMNYWLAEKSGLAQCHLPLFKLLKRMAVKGQQTARDLYGCQGFVAHHNTNLWANTDPESAHVTAGFWPMGGAWLCLHLYEHYQYTRDKRFLKEEALPIMREALRFFEGYLFEDEEGRLLTGPSLSPENSYISKAGEKGALCVAPTMDISILRQLIRSFLAGCREAGVELPQEEQRMFANMLQKLPPLQIGKDGRILEWSKEYEEVEPGHRHISHLFGLHPGTEIVKETPELFKAAGKTLDYRLSHGGGHTGWSKAWITCFYARLGRGEAVGENIIQLLQRSIQDNMWDIHPPFQIDGNFGIAEAMMEALIQSHSGYIELLPALPPDWEKGHVRGMHLRGGFIADMSWEKGEVKDLYITGLQDGRVDILYHGIKTTITVSQGERTKVEL